jgi:hypothetical protein
MALRVLLTNFMVSSRTGSELYTRDIATALLARGHRPIVYSTVLGPLAEKLRAATVPVVDDLADVSTVPDIIHGHHNFELVTALLRFPRVPAVRVCHGWADQRPWQAPRIRRFVCVDETVQDRVISEWGIPERLVQLLPNFVDLREVPRRGPLPPSPARALVFSHNAADHLPVVRRACERLGIAVDAVGQSVGAVTDRPGEVLVRYDLVFAKARCAYEAIAAGAAVVLCDAAGVGPLVTSANVQELQRLNFGVRTLNRQLDEATIVQEVSQYDADDAGRVTDSIRATASLDRRLGELLLVYDEVIREHREAADAGLEDDLRNAAAYLRTLAPAMPTDYRLRTHAFGLLRALYFSAERSPLLGQLLPRRGVARRLAALVRSS